MRRQVDRTPAERFWEFVEKTSACWQWRGAISHGYGNFHLRTNGQDRMVQAHRWAYEHLVGPIPSGLDLDHLCRNQACVNPKHLQPVTRQVNVIRGDVATVIRTNKCRNGHFYDEETTYWNPQGVKVCRICSRASAKRYRARRGPRRTR